MRPMRVRFRNTPMATRSIEEINPPTISHPSSPEEQIRAVRISSPSWYRPKSVVGNLRLTRAVRNVKAQTMIMQRQTPQGHTVSSRPHDKQQNPSSHLSPRRTSITRQRTSLKVAVVARAGSSSAVSRATTICFTLVTSHLQGRLEYG